MVRHHWNIPLNNSKTLEGIYFWGGRLHVYQIRNRHVEEERTQNSRTPMLLFQTPKKHQRTLSNTYHHRKSPARSSDSLRNVQKFSQKWLLPFLKQERQCHSWRIWHTVQIIKETTIITSWVNFSQCDRIFGNYADTVCKWSNSRGACLLRWLYFQEKDNFFQSGWFTINGLFRITLNCKLRYGSTNSYMEWFHAKANDTTIRRPKL